MSNLSLYAIVETLFIEKQKNVAVAVNLSLEVKPTSYAKDTLVYVDLNNPDAGHFPICYQGVSGGPYWHNIHRNNSPEGIFINTILSTEYEDLRNEKKSAGEKYDPQDLVKQAFNKFGRV